MYAQVVVVDCRLLAFASFPNGTPAKAETPVTGVFEDFRPCRAAPLSSTLGGTEFRPRESRCCVV